MAYRLKHPTVKRCPTPPLNSPEARHRYERYRLTEDRFEALLSEQNHCCSLCKKPFGGDGNPRHRLAPAVDHDHVTNTVRGLLHQVCNRKLGVIENASFLRSALCYLERWRHEFSNQAGADPDRVNSNAAEASSESGIAVEANDQRGEIESRGISSGLTQ